MIGDNITNTLNQLNSVRYRKTKFICINDQMESPTPQLKQILKDFYLSFFPYPSQFELPSSRVNPTLYFDEYLALQQQQRQQEQHSTMILSVLGDRSREIYVSLLQTARHALIETVWLFYEWLTGQTHPTSSLIHWSKGSPQRREEQSRTTLSKTETGISFFLPYSSLFWSTIGLCGVIALRLLFRIDRKRQLKNKKGANLFSGVIDSEKRRYYQTSSGKRPLTEEENESMECDGEGDGSAGGSYDAEADGAAAQSPLSDEDLLNKLWRSAGYGVSDDKKRSDKFMKGSQGETPLSTAAAAGDDDLSVSTLGMEGLEHEDEEEEYHEGESEISQSQ
jgi:hypothetical protein